MKLAVSILFAVLFCIVPAFGQMGIITNDYKLSALEKAGKYDEAVADIDERIKVQPNNGELYLRRAKFLKLQNKLDEAIADIGKGIEIEPDKPSFYIARAEYYNLKNDNEAVLKDVKTATSLASNKIGVLISGASELTRGKQYEENINLANFYLAHNTLNAEDFNWLNYYAYKIRGENKFVLKNYVEALRDSITAINYISFTGKYEEDFTARIAIDKMLGSHIVLQTTQNYLKDDEKIFDYYNQLFDALEKKTEISVEQSLQRDIRFKKQVEPNKPIDTAFMVFPQVVSLEKLMINCAELYVEKGQPEKGIELFERIVNLKLPNKWSRYVKRADFYTKLKKYQLAIDDLTAAVSGDDKVSSRYPSYILFLNKRGRLYEATSQFDKAIADYEMVNELNAGNNHAMDEMIAKARQKQIESANQSK